jgi:hypothetical protein
LRRLVPALMLLFIVAAALPALPATHAQGTPQATVNSQYLVNRYGYAMVNETVKLRNNGSSTLQVPDMQIGLGNLTSLVTSFNVSGAGYSVSSSTGAQGQVYTVSGGGTSLAAGANSSFSFKALLNGVTKTINSTMTLAVLDRPYLSFSAVSEKLVVNMPGNTELKSAPSGFKLSVAGTNVTYYQILNRTGSQQALTESLAVQQSASMDFHPVAVHYATRQVTVSSDGSPLVKDSITLQNLGTTELDTLTVAPLTTASGQVAILPSTTPPILSVAHVSFNKNGIDLTNVAVGLPVNPGANLTITYEYPLAKQYYNVSGGVVSVAVPLAPPIAAFVSSYSLELSLPPGVRIVQAGPQTMTNVEPFKAGTASLSYSLSVGWAVDGGVPAASSLFVILLIGLFAARTRMAPAEEEEEEETATVRATDMVKAFEEKTSLINGMFEEIPKADPSQYGKAYFDELRGRLDTFRGRALQRLNEMKQKSTTQKFFDLLGQIHETERELDRAAKDMLNLYEQYYTKRMRQEVFERLLPNYKRRLEKALDRLSDELNTAQRESKLL